jgi:TPR repeat protein
MLYKLSNISDGEFHYAKLLFHGFNNQKPDTKTAINIFEKLALKDHPESNFILYKIKQKNALNYLIKAADCGLKEAQTELGKLYLNGDNVERDLEKARSFLKKACDQGFDQAAIHLAQVLKQQNGDSLEIYNLTKRSALLGDPNAQFELGEMYANNSSIPKQNINWAIDYFEMAHEQGYLPATLKLANIYLSQNPSLALLYYQKVLDSKNIKYVHEAQRGLSQIKSSKS